MFGPRYFGPRYWGTRYFGEGDGAIFAVPGVDIREAVASRLLGDTVLAHLVQGRAFPMVLPQGQDMPAVTFQVISDKHNLNLDGSDKTASAKVAMTAISDDYDQCIPVARQLRVLFQGFRGDMDGLDVMACFQDSGFAGRDHFLWEKDGTGAIRYAITLVFRIHYRTPI